MTPTLRQFIQAKTAAHSEAARAVVGATVSEQCEYHDKAVGARDVCVEILAEMDRLEGKGK